ncbi:TetR/AcrR family transcriptional regulator [Microbacterium sp. cx-59]|uniref:TetR/AcrR family transcriptional regulator n=1 Tax=Microbacterium sp. cx-59 TaxID=2891207 RepID=UPI001E5C58E3|nr:TetR/AcrR family transcriptional regulator [Microbacterium sp. cx-59]MCC4909227.1 TetR/AcrR family transcriptional regulator [Microbacterium sp. cx-59]
MTRTTPTPKPRGPYAKTARRQQDIIDAATNVFATSGYHGGSLRDIARTLGMSLTSVVHHFSTKSDLLIAVLENADHTGADWLEDRMREVGVRVALPELVESNFRRPELLRLFTILSSEASAPDHPAHGWFARRYSRVTSQIAESIAEDQAIGRVAGSVDAPEAAKLIIAAWDGLQLQWLLTPDEQMGASFERILALILTDAQR